MILAIAIAWQLWRFETISTSLDLPLIGEISTEVHPYASLIPFCIWVATVVIAPVVILWPRIVLVTRAIIGLCCNCLAESKRVRSLLVIDDLDRCDPLQMLDVIESTLLILDDKEIKSRLQVAIMVDEFAFTQALAKKYAILLPENDGKETCSKFNIPRLVRENQEKFFLLQMRLPELRLTDVPPIIAALSDGMISEGRQELGNSENSDNVPVMGRADHADLEQMLSSPNEDAGVSVDVVLYPRERDRIAQCIAVVLEEDPSLPIGPRSINCILHRYQMARAILAKSYSEIKCSDLAEAIVREYVGLPFREDDEESAVKQVAKLVC